MQADDAGLTPRVVKRVRADYPENSDDVLVLLRGVESGNQNRERVVAAVVVSAAGDPHALRDAIETSRQDWRDALVGGGLADDGWQGRLDEILGPP